MSEQTSTAHRYPVGTELPGDCPRWCDHRKTNHVTEETPDGWDGTGLHDTPAGVNRVGERTHSAHLASGTGWSVAIRSFEINGQGMVEGPGLYIDTAPGGLSLHDPVEAHRLAAIVEHAADILAAVSR